MDVNEGWARMDVAAQVKRPGTLVLTTTDAANFEYSIDGSTVLQVQGNMIIAPEHTEGTVTRNLYIRPNATPLTAGAQATITGTIIPDDNAQEAIDKVNVNSGSLIIWWPSVSTPPYDVVLGTTLNIGYYKGGYYETVTLEIRNAHDTVIYSADLSSTSEGVAHVTTWDTKWNRSPHSGAYANPTNGPYHVRLVGSKGGSEMASNTITIDTVLILELEVRDDRPAADQISSGICPNAVDASHPAAIMLGVQPAGGGSPTLGTGALEFSNITPADLDNDPATQQIRDALVRQTMAAGLADGSYHVVIKRLRDKAGNAGADGYPASGDVSVIDDWTIRMY